MREEIGEYKKKINGEEKKMKLKPQDSFGEFNIFPP